MMDGQVKFDLSGLKEIREQLFANAVEDQTKRLLEYAPLILKKAYNEKTFKNDKWNLADSYVWVVYYDGDVMGSGYLWNSKVATSESVFHKKKIDGRKLADKFVNNYYSDVSNGWEVVWAATAPYSTYLENGTRGKRFYVISSIVDDIAYDFNGMAKINFTINIE